MKRLVFINPVLVIQKDDFLGSGIPYMPHILAYTVGLLKKHEFGVKVIDAFGLNPNKLTRHGDFYWQGLGIEEIVDLIEAETDAVFIYSSAITNVDFNLLLIKRIKDVLPNIRIGLLGNTQAVTSFDVSFLSSEFFENGADIIVYNDIERTVLNLVKNDFVVKENVICKEGKKIVKKPMSGEIGITNELMIPAWEEFPLENYWKLGYSHGPMQGKYLAILTSYGCPYRCRFCVNPGVNKSRWQAKRASLGFEEMKYLKKRFGVKEFHLEDLDPTIEKERIKDLSRLILKNKLKIRWKIVSGTKVETIDEEALNLMAKSGCVYISISPETGSERVLGLMNKRFDYKHADWFIKECSRLGVKTQACFVVGFPGEKKGDRIMTESYIKKITKLGVDEIALFIATPLPGAEMFTKMKGYSNFSDLTFSPKWRKDYLILERFRKQLYKKFIWWKLVYQPVKMFRQLINVVAKNFETKMEMTSFRILKFRWLLSKNGF